jgi:hypothetical protein
MDRDLAINAPCHLSISTNMAAASTWQLHWSPRFCRSVYLKAAVCSVLLSELLGSLQHGALAVALEGRLPD